MAWNPDNFYRGIDRNLSKQPGNPFDDEKMLTVLHDRAEKRVFSDAPKLEDFKEFFPKAQIDKDNDRMKARESEIRLKNSPKEKKMRQVTEIVEAVFIDGITRYQWMGNNVRIHPASRFDDLFAGVDTVLQIRETEESSEEEIFLGLGIDVMLGEDDTFIEKKINLIKDQIQRGELAHIKYFLNEAGEPVANMHVPKFVVALSGKDATELMQLWADNNKQKLSSHPIKISVLRQLVAECNEFGAFAENAGQYELADAYARALANIQEKIINPNPEFKELFSGMGRDPIAAKIVRHIRSFSEAEL